MTAATSVAIPSAPPEFVNHFINIELLHIERWAQTLGVSLQTTYDEAIHISDIGRDRSDPSTKGKGREVINKIIDLADAANVDVEVEHMTDEPALGDYYRSFGFLPYGEPGEITNLRRPYELGAVAHA